MRSASSDGVRVVRDEPEKIALALEHHVRTLRAHHPEILRVIWFGSRVSGQPTRASDVDLCIILSESDQPFLLRGAAYRPGPFPTGIDLFVYTESEFADLRESSPGWVAEIDRGLDV